MAILLTGGAGFIGSHTAVACLNAGVEVVLADNFSNSSPKVLDRIEKITGKRPALYNVDICDKQALRGIFAEQSITGVVHFAGLKAVGESVAKPWEYYDNNLNTTLVLTKVMKEVGMKNIIFSSSATVYTADNEMPLRETSRTGGCTNPYGWTKVMIEQILRDPEHMYAACGRLLLEHAAQTVHALAGDLVVHEHHVGVVLLADDPQLIEHVRVAALRVLAHGGALVAAGGVGGTELKTLLQCQMI